jgi:hypothetical protein
MNGNLRSRILICLGAVLLSGCDAGGEAQSGDPAAITAPSAAGCREAPQWRQLAVEAAGAALETASDQARITRLNRANFYSAMAISAELHCLTADSEAEPAVDAALNAVLDAARRAASARSFYEQTIHWGEAQRAANQVIEGLIQQMAAR